MSSLAAATLNKVLILRMPRVAVGVARKEPSLLNGYHNKCRALVKI